MHRHALPQLPLFPALNIWQPVYLSFCQQCFQSITLTHELTCPLCICIAYLSRNPMHLLYALQIASTAMALCIINTNLPTRNTFTVHPHISMSLPWACHFSYPHSLIVRHVKVLKAHKKKPYTAAAALLMCALLARLTPWVNPHCRYLWHAIRPQARGIVHMCRGHANFSRG